MINYKKEPTGFGVNKRQITSQADKLEILKSKALCFLNDNNLIDLEKTLNKLLELDSVNIFALKNLALISHKLRKYKEAENRSDSPVAANHNNPLTKKYCIF